jgi:hypothetical protein
MLMPVTLSSFSEVESWVVKVMPQAKAASLARYHVKFDQPVDGRAIMHVQDDKGYTSCIISAFTWKQTFMLRKVTKFGSNHAHNEQTLYKIVQILGKMAVHFSKDDVEEGAIANSIS